MAAAAPRLRVWFLHPDLGLGGAEMLVVNAALALQRRGRAVRIVTAHHDPERSFSETKAGGPLGACVEVRGDWLPRTVLGRLHVACAVLRMAWASLSVAARSALGRGPHVLVVDQVAHVVPLLQWLTGLPVVFYCHFPDKLLCVERSSLLKRAYRAPFDWWEEASTGAADAVVVNSRFTGAIFRESFASLSATPLRVLYPAIDLSQFDRVLAAPAAAAAAEGLPAALRQLLARPQDARSGPVLLLSINRFERKKNLALAVEAFAALRAMLEGAAEPDVGEIAGPGEAAAAAATGRGKAAQRAAEDRALLARVHLVLAGGYDPRLEENVSYCAELAALAQARGLAEHVSFVKSFSDDQRLLLVQAARAVVYTPDREHFGIVPIEAMYAARPVVAVASGGPLESVSHGETGWLVPQEPASFARALLRLVRDASLAAKMGQAGKRTVAGRFSLDAFGAGLDAIVTEQLERASSRGAAPRLLRLALLALLCALLAAALLAAARATLQYTMS